MFSRTNLVAGSGSFQLNEVLLAMSMTADNGSGSEPVSQTEEMQTSAVMNVGAKVEHLKKEKQANKTQVTRLVRLMSEDTDQEALLDCLETFVDKKFETLDVIGGLLSAYRQAGDEKNVIKTLDKLGAVGTDADRDVASVKAFLSTTFRHETTANILVTKERKKEQPIQHERKNSQFNSK